AGALDLALAREPRAVIADFHEAARRHLAPVQAERDLVVAVVRAGDAEGQVVEDAFVETVHHGQAMGGREIDPRLRPRGLEVDAVFDRFLQHGRSPWVCRAESANTQPASMRPAATPSPHERAPRLALRRPSDI